MKVMKVVLTLGLLGSSGLLGAAAGAGTLAQGKWVGKDDTVRVYNHTDQNMKMLRGLKSTPEFPPYYTDGNSYWELPPCEIPAGASMPVTLSEILLSLGKPAVANVGAFWPYTSVGDCGLFYNPTMALKPCGDREYHHVSADEVAEDQDGVADVSKMGTTDFGPNAEIYYSGTEGNYTLSFQSLPADEVARAAIVAHCMHVRQPTREGQKNRHTIVAAHLLAAHARKQEDGAGACVIS